MARIELVSRPLMIFGRHSAAAGTGFGDFTLGFVPKYNRISRLHSVICALGDQLALMSASDEGYTYQSKRPAAGARELAAAGSRRRAGCMRSVSIEAVLAWDHKGEHAPLDWDNQEPRDKFGRYLLELVDVLHQRDRQANADALRDKLKTRYLKLLHMQERVARLNGVGNPGACCMPGSNARTRLADRSSTTTSQIGCRWAVPRRLAYVLVPRAWCRGTLNCCSGRYVLDSESGRAGFGSGGLSFFGHQRGAGLGAGDMLRIGTARLASRRTDFGLAGGGGLRQRHLRHQAAQRR